MPAIKLFREIHSHTSYIKYYSLTLNAFVLSNPNGFRQNKQWQIIFSFVFTFTEAPSQLSSTGWMIGGFDSRQTLGIFLFITASRPTLGPTQPPIQRIPGTLCLGIKRPGREAHHSPPSSVEVKEGVELYFHTPNTSLQSGARLK
jgi:hypothetical protein